MIREWADRLATSRVARWFWRLLPEERRHAIYRVVSTVPNRGPKRTRGLDSLNELLALTDHALDWTKRRVIGLGRLVTLANYRARALFFWPQLRGWDLHVTTLVLFALRFHQFLLARTWGNAHHLRRRRLPRAAGTPLRVMHVTSSFDLGGTQQQIKNLCTYGATRFEHTTTEIFPENNFLYRAGIGVDADRYAAGGVLMRALGRCAAQFNTRSGQLIQAYKLFRDFSVFRPDVVVGWGHEMAVTSFVGAALARVPHVVFCIRTFNPAYGWVIADIGQLLATAHRRMTPYAAVVITNSTPLRDDHAQWVGIDPARIEVCPNGIEALHLSTAEIHARRVAVRARLGIEADAKVAINVGRFSAEKGQQTIIAINERLQGRVQWLLCGDGPTATAVRGAADAAGMTNVHFIGRTTEVYDYLCASDIFVMPSDFEGMPNAMMEAMACGLPCVSTNRSGAIDVARHGVEALFYKVGDLEAMEQHVRFLLDHPDEARAMGQRAQARLSEFSTARSLERFEQILERATLSK